MSKLKTSGEVGIQRADEDVCVPTILPESFSAADAVRVAAVFKALADPVRLRIFSNVAAHEGGEACVCEVADVGVSQPTVSHHLKKLREAGLLISERRGTSVYYKVVPAALAPLAEVLPAQLTRTMGLRRSE
ncbi:ArsR/SmtB family transcription factor [Streptomyces sp. WMMC1477]|uniref:ArsR/SmtB family transcription factor n=1 Tax=Streptomyces sp. WMMC1477 TaxID=3015155 RepID=UPI0022B66F82|nr:metalloregulator ArsR/SmtB family transcription factor [Streptomyces sp. WMMC1477]MCZ7431112.1 metalloregulator ArsR/SmtB family transcription factor [Streptomyces sp. WMMC1477]